MKILMVFDFDHTVVDANCDIWVINCLPGQILPNSVEDSYRDGHWTEYMCRVMNYIGEQGVSPDRVCATMETIPLTAGMTDLLTFISENKSTVDCIVISDANSIFIDCVLKASGLQAAVDQVFTNPAKFNESGYMDVQCYHSHDCNQCPINLCKRRVLELYLTQKSEGGVEYERIFYVGDGGNDLCPSLSLREHDVVMPRSGFRLEKLLTKLKAKEGDAAVRAKVVTWRSGAEILQLLKASLQS